MGDSTERKVPPGFEPPPWEREQFEELARRREQQQAEPEEQSPAGAQGESPPGETLSSTGTAAGSQTEKKSHGGDPAETTPPLDDKMVDALMVQLRAEEPPAEGPLWRAGIFFAIFMTAIGIALSIWGVAALVRTSDSQIGVAAASILLIFGAAFVGLGIWTAVRSLKQRGVL